MSICQVTVQPRVEVTWKTEVTWKQTQLTLFTQLLLPQTAEEKMLQLLQVLPL